MKKAKKKILAEHVYDMKEHKINLKTTVVSNWEERMGQRVLKFYV